MAKIDKLIERLLLRPADFTWDELVNVLGYLGYKELKKGKTGGSRRNLQMRENKSLTCTSHTTEIL